MRIFANVIGVGQRKKGISKKSGKAYDMQEISISYDHHMFSGQKCETIAVDGNIIGDRVIAVGDSLDMVIHQANFKTYVDAIL